MSLRRGAPRPGLPLLALVVGVNVIVLGLLGCSGRGEAPAAAPQGDADEVLGSVASLASFAFDAGPGSPFAGHAFEATCRLRLDAERAARPGESPEPTASGEGFASGLLGALEEHVRYRLAPKGHDFHVRMEQSFDDRFVRQGSDAMEAVRLGERLAVRRQREIFAEVPNLHGEAARYQEIGRGVLGALLEGFDPASRREGDRVLLGPGSRADALQKSPGESAAPTVLPGRPNDIHWAPHFRYYASAAVQRGFLLWPEGDPMPRAGEFIVDASLNGHAFHADCAFLIEAAPGREGLPELPKELPSLDRVRVHRDLEQLRRAVRPPSD